MKKIINPWKETEGCKGCADTLASEQMAEGQERYIRA